MTFGRLEKPVGHKPMSDINVTPLVDVMLVLLVIFMIAAPLMASRIALDLPPVAPPAEVRANDQDAVQVVLDAQGKVYWQDEETDWDGLAQRLKMAGQANPATEVRLRADRTVAYEHVARLIALAQQAGLKRIGFMTDADEARRLGLETSVSKP